MVESISGLVAVGMAELMDSGLAELLASGSV